MGLDPLPNILVYVPNAAVDAFTLGVSCPVVGQPPSGSPLVGTTTNFDGTFTIPNMPVGANIPLVIQTGRLAAPGSHPDGFGVHQHHAYGRSLAHAAHPE